MRKSTGSRIRIKDIAEKAGVSPGTVDRVLHNRGEVAAGTRNQVMAIVKELGYTPNILAKSLASKKLYRIAALIPDSDANNPYWEKPKFGIQQAADEIKDFNAAVTINTFNLYSKDTFLSKFEEICEARPDGLIFTPVFFTESHIIIKKCEEQDIPYVFIDINLDACNNLAYFGQNAEQSAFLAAKLMYYGLPEESNVLLIRPVRKEGVSHHLERREKGFLSYFLSSSNKKNINTRVIELDINDQEVLASSVDQAFAEDEKIKGVFVNNSRAFKIAQYLKDRNMQDVLLIGYDLITENLDFLERGIINFLIGQKPEEQGYKSVQAMFSYLISGKTFQKTNYSSIDIIMKENIDYYKNFKF